jgi:hypothetical protein
MITNKHYFMLIVGACTSMTITANEYFQRNTQLSPDSRDRYQYNLDDIPGSTTFMSYKNTRSIADQPSADDYVVRQYGQAEVPRYVPEWEKNESQLMQEDRIDEQEKAQRTSSPQESTANVR